MLKSAVAELILNLRYNRIRDNLTFLFLYAVYMYLSLRLTGISFAVMYFLFYCIFYVAVMSLISLEPGKVCSYMVPLSDKERKRNYYFRLSFHAGILSFVMQTGIIAATYMGGPYGLGLERMKDNFDCVILLGVMCFLFSLMPASGERTGKTDWLKLIVNYATIGVYSLAAPILFVNGDGRLMSGMMIYMYSPDNFYQRNAVLIAVAAVIVLQIIMLIKSMSRPLLYEYSVYEIIQGIMMKGGKQK